MISKYKNYEDFKLYVFICMFFFSSVNIFNFILKKIILI